uniref:Uncharacterized protein n=1 Tax=Trichinella nativa TaxID=6335 RepID=A0A0V1KJA8_9BILA
MTDKNYIKYYPNLEVSLEAWFPGLVHAMCCCLK